MKKTYPPQKKPTNPDPKTKTNNNKNQARNKNHQLLRASAPESWKNWTFCRCRWNGRTTLKWKAIFAKVQKWRDRNPPKQTQKVKMQKHHKVSGINSCQPMLFVFGVVTFHWTNSLALENRPLPKENSLPTITFQMLYIYVAWGSIIFVLYNLYDPESDSCKAREHNEETTFWQADSLTWKKRWPTFKIHHRRLTLHP